MDQGGSKTRPYLSSVKLPRGFPRIARTESRLHLLGERMGFAREQHGAPLSRRGFERGFQYGDRLLFRERGEGGERGLLAIPFAVVEEGAAEKDFRFFANALRFLLELRTRARNQRRPFRIGERREFFRQAGDQRFRATP